MDLNDDDNVVQPHDARIIRLPNDPSMVAVHELYKTSVNTLRLQSEQNREVFPEAFIEGSLDTLANLCVKALAKRGIRNAPQIVAERPELMRVLYDALDVELPLSDCYFIDDQRYWQRVVFAKCPDKKLRRKSWHEYDWRAKGLSLKYVELVESCPAAFWPETQMAELAALIQEYVTAIHIKRLQALPDTVFAKYDLSEGEIDVSSESSEEEPISSDEPDTDEDMGEDEGEEEEEVLEKPVRKPVVRASETEPKKDSSAVLEKPVLQQTPRTSETEHKTDSSVAIDSKRKTAFLGNIKPASSASPSTSQESFDETAERRKARHFRNAARQQLRDLAAEKYAKHLERRLKREKMLEEFRRTVEQTKKKKKKKAIKGVFDIPVEPEPSDHEDQKTDMRNRGLLLRHHKRFNYPTELCHHIDLGFVRFFENLTSFTLEFLGTPDTNHEHFKSYQLKFSYDDMTHLAKGLLHLKQLQIFRLRNSLMDSKHLGILARALRFMDSLEEIDFGYDQMQDDCSNALQIMMDRTTMFKTLQLEYNRLGVDSMDVIGMALAHHKVEDDFLEYLGLAHNPLCDNALGKLFHWIHGTGHVHSLNINGIDGRTSMASIGRVIGILLRSHNPLRRLEMAAIPLGPAVGLALIRALEQNRKILYFDCRECDLDSDQEFQVDIIVRRNNYWVKNPPIDEICDLIKNRKHPLIENVQSDYRKYKECLISRPSLPRSRISSIKEVVEEKEEEEYDIWAILGITTRQTTRIEIESSETSEVLEEPFVYEPNKFNLDQFRELVDLPGPSNRFFYFKKNRMK
ncbi:GL23487 [Drosophila persimilis]|uniref:GL23487 n=1 Tax=Drosophila persimilis TaxID=7234 RepID=B4G367_DROPE|nr:uncharacterized protein LOC6587834 [Drosophila persimilis]EDW24262.1 GL23487 [Drosophila persimilis]